MAPVDSDQVQAPVETAIEDASSPTDKGNGVVEVGETDEEHFWSRVGHIPFVSSTADVYQDVRGHNRLFGAGFTVMEKSISISVSPARLFLGFVTRRCPNKTTSLDNWACSTLEKLETRCPSIQEPPRQIAANLQQGAKDVAKTTARVALNSIPGQLVMGSIDLAVKVSEKALDCVNTNMDQIKAEADASVENGGTPDGRLIRVKTHIVGQIQWVNDIAVVRPLKQWVSIVRSTQGVANRLSRRNHRTKHSRKKAESRKKRQPRSFVRRLTDRAFGLIGRKTADDKKGGKREKLKSEASIGDLDESLESDSDDPDYKYKDCSASSDSLEYASGETESDLEAEKQDNAEVGPEDNDLVQIRTATTIKKDEPKAENKVDDPTKATGEAKIDDTKKIEAPAKKTEAAKKPEPVKAPAAEAQPPKSTISAPTPGVTTGPTVPAAAATAAAAAAAASTTVTGPPPHSAAGATVPTSASTTAPKAAAVSKEAGEKAKTQLPKKK